MHKAKSPQLTTGEAFMVRFYVYVLLDDEIEVLSQFFYLRTCKFKVTAKVDVYRLLFFWKRSFVDKLFT